MRHRSGNYPPGHSFSFQKYFFRIVGLLLIISSFHSCLDIEFEPKTTIEWSDHVQFWLEPVLPSAFNHLEARVFMENNNPEKIDIIELSLILTDSAGREKKRVGSRLMTNGEFVFHFQDLDPNIEYQASAYMELYSFYFKGSKERMIYSDTHRVRTLTLPGSDEVWDVDGNRYPVVKIGEQSWMAMDLRSRHFNTGEIMDSIGDVSSNCPGKSALGLAPDKGARLSEPHRRKMYNYFAAEDERGVCPAGWRVPSVSDVQRLAENLGGWKSAGGHLKSSLGWARPNVGASNSTAFTAIPYLERGNCSRSPIGTVFEWTRSINFNLDYSQAKYWVLPDDPNQQDTVYSMILSADDASLTLLSEAAVESLPLYYSRRKNDMNCIRCIRE